ncbi:heme biosynthesis protein HemY [Lentilitoribacter sp. Alg239-R112]|uniref:heme biosynthesis protein HemY n=1 Tax=Lentilitoribacter sp. Alg239-R112 TaxID=2305987 RepID=UPI0013A6A899|nr:heme biosynthesis protein HemY [Lentilitoribacter sp. Alg239-R112]
MIKGLIFIALILVLGTGFAWLADRPGELLINWQGQQIELSLMTAVSAIAALVVTIMFIWWIIRLVLSSPQIMSRYFKSRRKDRGYKALSQGLIAAGAGDATLAKKLTNQSKGLLDAGDEPLIKLLAVQTAMIDGRDEDARKTLQEMSETPETAVLGLRGLYLEAKRLGANEAASQYATKAADQAPHLEWAGNAAIEVNAQEGNWDDAIRRLEKQRTANAVSPDLFKRKKAVLLAGRAMGRADGELSDIAKDAQNALTLAPDLIPAAVIAAKAYFQMGQLRKGSKILEKIWKQQPHPQVSEAYVSARVGDTSGDRLKRALKLESIRSHHAESLLVVAKMAMEAHDLKLARERAESAAKMEPRKSMYLLLADIEEADTGDQGRVRHWLANAVRASRDPQWTADGYVSEEWAPFSPVTGKLDAFEWKVPLTALAGAVEEGEIAEDNFAQAMADLPAISAPVFAAASVINEAEPEAKINIKAETIEPEIKTETSQDEEVAHENASKEVETTDINDENQQANVDEALEKNTEDAPEEEVLRKAVDDPGVAENTENNNKSGGFRLF